MHRGPQLFESNAHRACGSTCETPHSWAETPLRRRNRRASEPQAVRTCCKGLAEARNKRQNQHHCADVRRRCVPVHCTSALDQNTTTGRTEPPTEPGTPECRATKGAAVAAVHKPTRRSTKSSCGDPRQAGHPQGKSACRGGCGNNCRCGLSLLPAFDPQLKNASAGRSASPWLEPGTVRPSPHGAGHPLRPQCRCRWSGAGVCAVHPWPPPMYALCILPPQQPTCYFIKTQLYSTRKNTTRPYGPKTTTTERQWL